MTAQEFQHYLDQPHSLLQLQLTDLQEIALKFPYSANIRLLLLLKTHLEGHPEETSYLNRCAAMTFDRAHIYELIRELDASLPEEIFDETETLELKELEELHEQPTAETSSPISIALPSVLNEIDEPPVPGILTPRPTEEESIPHFEPSGSSKNKEQVLLSIDNWVGNAATFLTILPAHTPTPKGSNDTPERPELFVTTHSPGLQQRLKRIRRQQAQRKDEGQESVNKIARRSLLAQDDVASETLARLLVQQGQYQNAIKMYRRLMLLYPDKKTIFAGLINDLKEKL
jgi:tetratricopeptide (TPR) repeat protein